MPGVIPLEDAQQLVTDRLKQHAQNLLQQAQQVNQPPLQNVQAPSAPNLQIDPNDVISRLQQHAQDAFQAVQQANQPPFQGAQLQVDPNDIVQRLQQHAQDALQSVDQTVQPIAAGLQQVNQPPFGPQATAQATSPTAGTQQEIGPSTPTGAPPNATDAVPHDSASGRVFPVQNYNGQVDLHWGDVKGGSDLFAPRGTPVLAMQGGKVIESGENSVGGNSVLIQGDDGLQYYYAHGDATPSVKVGDRVTAGTYLMPVGDTGDAKGRGTHLHIGIGPDIRLGADKYGGTGGDFDAVGLLRSTLAPQDQQQGPVQRVVQAGQQIVGQGQKAFVDTLAPLAQQVAQRTGIDPGVMLAIAANETGWGQSSNAQQQNNLFSIQGDGSNGSRWASYKSPQESFDAFVNLISSAPRYAQAWADRADPSKFIDDLRNAGYVADEPGFPAQGWVDQVKSIATHLPVVQGAPQPDDGGASAQRQAAVGTPLQQGVQTVTNLAQQGGQAIGTGLQAVDSTVRNLAQGVGGAVQQAPGALRTALQQGADTLGRGLPDVTGTLKPENIPLGGANSPLGKIAQGQQVTPTEQLEATPQIALGYEQSRGQAAAGIDPLRQLPGGSTIGPIVEQLTDPASWVGVGSARNAVGVAASVAASVTAQQVAQNVIPDSDPNKNVKVALVGLLGAFTGGPAGEMSVGPLLDRASAMVSNLGADGAATLARQAAGAAGERVAPAVHQFISEELGTAGAPSDVAALRSPAAAPAEPASTRMYHGTGSAFDRPDPGKFDANGLFGPGYYVTSDPRVAGGIVAPDTGRIGEAGYAQSQSPQLSRLTELQDTADELRSLLNGTHAMSGDAGQVAYATKELPVVEADIARLETYPATAGANVRAVDVPQNLKLFDADAPLDVPLLDRITSLLDPKDAQALTQALPYKTGRPDKWTNDVLYRKLSEIVDTPYANQLLRDAGGFDGVTHTGGQRVPMADATGAPIEHQVNVIFPESLDKIRNAISGRQGGAVDPLLAARLGGAAAGGFAGYQTTPEGASPEERLTRTLGGAAVGAGAVSGAELGIRGLLDPRLGEALQATRIGSLAGGIPTVAHIALNTPAQGLVKLMSDVPMSIGTGHPEAIPAELYGAAQGLLSWGPMAVRTLLDPGMTAERLARARGGVGTLPTVGERVAEAGLTGLVKTHPVLQELAGQMLEHMELWRQAAVGATNAGLTRLSPAWRAEVARLVANPTAPMTDAVARAGDIGRIRTPMGTTGKNLSRFIRTTPLARFVMPIFDIGYRLATQGIELSPLGAVGTAYDVGRAAVGRGPYAGPAGFAGRGGADAVTPLAQRIRNNVIGVGLTALGYQEASQGNITGEGPADPQKQQDLRDMGWQPDSVRIAGRYFDAHLLGPIGWSLIQGANTWESTHTPEQGGYAEGTKTTEGAQDPDAKSMLLDLSARSARYFNNETFLRGLGSTLNAIGATAQQGHLAAREAASIFESLIPQGAVLANIASIQDPSQRQPETGNIAQMVQTRIPGQREQVPERLTGVAQPVINPQQGLGILAPRSSVQNPDPVLRAYADVGVVLPPPPSTISAGPGRDIQLTPAEQRAYQTYAGQSLQSMAEPAVTDPSWNSNGAKTREIILKRIQDQARTVALQRITAEILGKGGYSRGYARPGSGTAPVEGFAPPNTVAAPTAPPNRLLQSAGVRP